MGYSATLQDVIAEVRENLSIIEKGAACSWTVYPSEGSRIIVSTISGITELPKTIAVTVDVEEWSIQFAYVGIDRPPGSVAVPRLPNGEYDLGDETPLYGICEDIIAPLRHVRC